MNQIQPTTSRRKEDGMTRPRQSQDAAGMTVAIHRGHHITHIREAGLLEQGGEQQTLQQSHVRALRFRQTTSGGIKTGTMLLYDTKPAIIGACGPLDRGERNPRDHRTRRPRRHTTSRKRNNPQEDRRCGQTAIRRTHATRNPHTSASPSRTNFDITPTTERGADNEPIEKPAHELQLTCGR